MMTVGFIAPHPPYIARQELFDYYYSRIADPVIEEKFEETLHPAIAGWRRRRDIEGISLDEWRRVRAAYYANVEDLDSRIGEVLACIERTLGLDNTIIIYGSDHGDSIGINNLVWKTTFYNHSVKVPLIFSGPGIMAGKTIDEPVCLLDATRTIIHYAGGPELPKPYGISLHKTLEEGVRLDPQRSIISQIGTYGKNPQDRDLPSAMIVKGDYKLISYHGFDYPSLFKLTKDPYESNDLGLDPEYANVRLELEEELCEYWDGAKALEICDDGLACFQIQQQWANKTQFKMVYALYNTVTDTLAPAWDMQSENTYVLSE